MLTASSKFQVFKIFIEINQINGYKEGNQSKISWYDFENSDSDVKYKIYN